MMSAGEATQLRRDLLRMMGHTYSRTPVTQGTEDAWGQAAQTAGTVTTAQPCLYSPTQTLRSDTGGRVTIDRPNIRVPSTDPLAVGDLVTVIADAAGTSLVSGTFKVDTAATLDNPGATNQLHYDWTALDVAEPGIFGFYFLVTMPGSKTRRFPNDGYEYLQVTPS